MLKQLFLTPDELEALRKYASENEAGLAREYTTVIVDPFEGRRRLKEYLHNYVHAGIWGRDVKYSLLVQVYYKLKESLDS